MSNQKEAKELRLAAERAESLRVAQEAKHKIFDPFQCIKTTEAPCEIVDEILGVVKFNNLTFAQGKQLEQHKDPLEKTAYMILYMLQPQNPGLTIEDIKKMPLHIASRLGKILGDHIQSFLSPPNTSK